MQTITDITDLRGAVRRWQRAGQTVALVPTMGALHAGHIALVERAQALADQVVASIFVNPMQFGPNEDFAAYPRRMAEDAAMLADAGTAILWAPDAGLVYPAGHATRVSVGGLDRRLCGAARPGHFDGVGTVVSILFNQVGPDIALFGEKDWQQLAIIRRMTRDLAFPVDIVGVPTVRDADGLALSSRNAYLSKSERRAAAALPKAMQHAARLIAGGQDATSALNAARASIMAAGFASIDYCDMRDGDTLRSLRRATTSARLFVAARIGPARLIDNIPVHG